MIFSLLAQMNPQNLLSDGMPALKWDGSQGLTWIVVALLATGILLITFKAPKRNHLETE